MFVRNGQKLGSVLVDEAVTEPQPPRKRAPTKKSAPAKKTAAKKAGSGAQLVGRIGSTGDSTGPHLHFEKPSDKPESKPVKEADDGD